MFSPLDTKGQVTTTGTAGDLAGELTWGKVLGETTVFEGTLNGERIPSERNFQIRN